VETSYFEPDSAIRRIGRESVLMLGGARALLLQAAHPLVAAGIVEHSDYATDPWRRLGRTLHALYTVVFGTCAEADAAGARVQAAHRRVHGRIRAPMGVFPAGTPYSATDPELQVWVHSTLVSTGIAMHETYVGPLTPEDCETFYEEMKVVARIFGVPDGALPATIDDMHAHEQRLLDEGVLCVTDAARLVARTVLSPPVPVAFRLPLAALARANAGLLPPQLREQYGVHWNQLYAFGLAASSRASRALLPVAPSPLRDVKRAGDHHDGLALVLLRLALR
jgi:uncharacterized protein (DUF2236 family)